MRKRHKKKPEATSRSIYESRGLRLVHHHTRSALQSMGQICQAPLHAIMTILVIAITLAMPLGLSALLGNIKSLSPHWEHRATISIYLKMNVAHEMAEHMVTAIRQDPAVRDAHYVTPETGLQQLKAHTGFGEILDELQDNPLPGVIIVTPTQPENMRPPTPTMHDHAHTLTLVENLENNPNVDKVKMDWRWIQRLEAIFTLAQQGIWLLSALLGMAVLLIIGNVVALTIQKFKYDIRTYQLLGATDYFIRLPFLYMGLWIGSLGSLASCGLVHMAMRSLQPAVTDVANQYDSAFILTALTGGQTIQATLLGALLGVGGAYLAVTRYLRVHRIL